MWQTQPLNLEQGVTKNTLELDVEQLKLNRQKLLETPKGNEKIINVLNFTLVIVNHEKKYFIK